MEDDKTEYIVRTKALIIFLRIQWLNEGALLE